MSFKIGSLFDGSGGFPLAGFLSGGVPVWASEIEPYPIAVTKSRFPYVKHLGSVTDINGAEIEPVDVISFGSPCQDLSVAGKRAGLKHEDNGDEETTRSGLFMEAVRIIKEMREATNGEYPRFALWENVPGAFSSNKGEDFKIVLEELIKIVEPSAVMPDVPQKGWAYADCYRGDGWSIAYRVFDAQYWGVPQRRRRIYLVADFRGERAGEILFKREGLRGYSSQSGSPWETAPGNVENGIGTADYPSFGINGEIAATLDASYYKGCGMRQGVEREVVFIPVAHSFDSLSSNSMKSSNPHSGCRQVDVSKCLDTTDPNPSKNQGGIAVLEPIPYTLKIRSGCEGGGKGALIQDDLSATLATNNDQYLFQPVYAIENHPNDSRVDIDPSGKVQTLTGRMGTGGGNVPMVLEDKTVYCLQGNGIDRADTAGCNGKGWKEDVCYTLNTIDRPAVVCVADHPTPKVDTKGTAFTLSARDYKNPQALTFETYQKVTGPLMANSHPGSYTGQDAYSDMLVAGEEKTSIPIRYIVRRLTPTECARLQGFPDCWGHPDHKDDFTDEEYAFWLNVRNTHAEINGKTVKDYPKKSMLTWYNKLHTDSSEYKMWGNGIALPNALYVMEGIAEVYTSV